MARDPYSPSALKKMGAKSILKHRDELMDAQFAQSRRDGTSRRDTDDALRKVNGEIQRRFRASRKK